MPKLPRSRGAAWHWHSVAEILRNVAYAGRAYSESRRRGGKGQLIPAAWPPIVSDALWTAARAVSVRRYARASSRGRSAPEAPYAFKGLLRCSCGARLHGAGKTRRHRIFYACRHSHDAAVPCAEKWVAEDALTPWARELLVELEALKPADFASRIDQMTAQPSSDSRGAVESIDRSLERLDQLFVWGNWTEDRYRAERERLESLKQELEESVSGGWSEPTLTDIVQTWDKGDAVARRELLATLFSDIHVCQGRVVGYTPRPDRASAVTRLMEAVRWKVSVRVGGDGLEPTTSSV